MGLKKPEYGRFGSGLDLGSLSEGSMIIQFYLIQNIALSSYIRASRV